MSEQNEAENSIEPCVELSPCPYCGGENFSLTNVRHMPFDKWVAKVCCNSLDCHATVRSRMCDTEQEAVEQAVVRWNRREGENAKVRALADAVMDSAKVPNPVSSGLDILVAKKIAQEYQEKKDAGTRKRHANKKAFWISLLCAFLFFAVAILIGVVAVLNGVNANIVMLIPIPFAIASAIFVGEAL